MEGMCKMVERDRLELGNSLEHKIDIQIRIQFLTTWSEPFNTELVCPDAMIVWVKIFHFLHGGRKFSLTETRERFEQQGDNNFKENKKGAARRFMKELTKRIRFKQYWVYENKILIIRLKLVEDEIIKISSGDAGLSKDPRPPKETVPWATEGIKKDNSQVPQDRQSNPRWEGTKTTTESPN